jgi:hypothetical protein
MSRTRYKVIRASTEPNLHVIFAGDVSALDRVPERVRKLGPWQGAQEGEIARMRPHYRALIAEQGFLVLWVRQDLMRLEVDSPSPDVSGCT